MQIQNYNITIVSDKFADKKREGVQLLSGSAVTIFEHLDEGIGMTPVEMMRKIIEDERYACITIAEAV